VAVGVRPPSDPPVGEIVSAEPPVSADPSVSEVD